MNTYHKYRRYRLLAIVSGIIMVASPLLGLGGTIFGMMRTFRAMGTNGVAEAEVISASIGETLIATASGIILACLGLLFFIPFLVLAILENRKLKRAQAAPLPDSSITLKTAIQKTADGR